MSNNGFPGTFSAAQTAQLLAPIRPNRVLQDPRGNSHVSQQDVTAHLIRVFGFGNFATELVDLVLIFERCREQDPAKVTHSSRWDVAYRATMRLSIYDENHNFVTSYEDASVGDAQNQNRQDAHDLAMKSAISLAKKRCCINLGDQFGLSLYNKGQTAALVRGTLVLPQEIVREREAAKEGDEKKPPTDIQEGIPQQESLGIDEIDKSDGVDVGDEEAEARIAASLGGEAVEGTEDHPDAIAARDKAQGLT
jgi:hypothetical protein